MDTLIEIKIPHEILISLNENEGEFGNEMKIAAALYFFQKNKLSIGKAAQLAGLSGMDFETYLSDNNIPISNLSLTDIDNDIKNYTT